MTDKLRRSHLLPGVSTLVAAAMLLVPASSPAQEAGSANGFSLGLGSGFVRASGEGPGYILTGQPLPDMGGLGYYMQATLETPSPLRMIRPRADLFFADWGTRVTGLTGNLLVTPFATKRFAPYLLAGTGAYAMTGSNVRSGWTLGAGLRLPGDKWSVNIESRAHAFLHTSQTEAGPKKWKTIFTPIGLGVQF